jgi:hypothetical protein
MLFYFVMIDNNVSQSENCLIEVCSILYSTFIVIYSCNLYTNSQWMHQVVAFHAIDPWWLMNNIILTNKPQNQTSVFLAAI